MTTKPEDKPGQDLTEHGQDALGNPVQRAAGSAGAAPELSNINTLKATNLNCTRPIAKVHDEKRMTQDGSSARMSLCAQHPAPCRLRLEGPGTGSKRRHSMFLDQKTLAVVACTLLGACSGTMQGMIRGSGAPVTFSYEQGMASNALTAVIDGEVFKGKAVPAESTSTVLTGIARNNNMPVFAESSTGAARAVLLGSRGSSLTCRLQYADSGGFAAAGGVGVCQHSDQRVIDVIW